MISKIQQLLLKLIFFNRKVDTFIALKKEQTIIKKIRRHNNQLIQRVSFDFYSTFREKYIPFYSELLNFLPDNEKIRIMDVGARGGSEINKWGPLTNKIEWHCFEVTEDACREMEVKDKAKGIHSKYYPHIISGSEEKRTFYLKKAPTGSSLYDNSFAETHFLENFKLIRNDWDLNLKDRVTITNTFTTNTLSLDVCQEKHSISAIDFIKIDVEGAELEVLQGGKKLVSSTLGVAFEVDFEPRFNPLNYFYSIDKELKESGFSFFDVTRFLRAGRRKSKFSSLEVKNNTIVSFGQAFGGDVIYFKDFSNHDLSETQLLKLATISFVYGYIEYSIDILNEILGRTANNNLKVKITRLFDQLK